MGGARRRRHPLHCRELDAQAGNAYHGSGKGCHDNEIAPRQQALPWQRNRHHRPATQRKPLPWQRKTLPRQSSTGPTGARPVEFVSPPTTRADLFDANDDPDIGHRYCRLLDQLDLDADNPGQAEQLLLTPSDEPTTLAKAEDDEHWCQAMLDELVSIEENSTWTLTDLPAGHKPIILKWVYKLKHDTDDNVVKYNARLVAKGYV